MNETVARTTTSLHNDTLTVASCVCDVHVDWYRQLSQS